MYVEASTKKNGLNYRLCAHLEIECKKDGGKHVTRCPQLVPEKRTQARVDSEDGFIEVARLHLADQLTGDIEQNLVGLGFVKAKTMPGLTEYTKGRSRITLKVYA